MAVVVGDIHDGKKSAANPAIQCLGPHWPPRLRGHKTPFSWCQIAVLGGRGSICTVHLFSHDRLSPTSPGHDLVLQASETEATNDRGIRHRTYLGSRSNGFCLL